MMRTTLFLLGLALLTACGAQKGASVSGTIKGAQNLQVTMDQFQFDGKNVTMGTATADANGAFTISRPEAFEKGIYKMQIGAKQIFFLLDGTEKKVSFTGEVGTINRGEMEVTGSEAMACYCKQIKELNALAGQFTPELAKEKVNSACNPLMGALMTSQFFGQQAANFIPEFKMAAEKLNNDMPGSKYATDYGKNVQMLENSMKQQAAGSTLAIAVGQAAPEINLPDPSGKKRALSDLKGKVVLLDFWASWCGPCRKENPNVVRVYNTYKDKGFTVFSVSLDRENGKDAWVQAIKQDGLVWDTHVSDLKFWNSEAGAIYGIKSIPQTFLLDREGKIAAINPRNNLEEAVKKALGN